MLTKARPGDWTEAADLQPGSEAIRHIICEPLERGSSAMQSSTPARGYYHPRLIQLIQQPQPEYENAVDAVHEAEALVRDMRQTLKQAEQQLTQAQAQLQQTISAQQEQW